MLANDDDLGGDFLGIINHIVAEGALPGDSESLTVATTTQG